MRSLSATLLEAQKMAPFAYPYIKVELTKRVGAVTRLDWESLYAGAEPDFYHSATMPGDGSLVRVRVDPNTHNLYRQRVTDPDEESTYSSWTLWTNSTYAVALASYGQYVTCLRINDGGWCYESHSSDYGASWSAWDYFDLGSSPAASVRVAVAYKNATTILFLFSGAGSVYKRLRVGDDWGSWAAWSNSLSSISGVAVVHLGDWNVVVTGVDTSSQDGIWTCVLGDGYSAPIGTWSSLLDLIVRGSTEPYEYHFPYIDRPDVFRIYFVEKFTQADAQSRLYFTHYLPGADFISNLWREPIPLDVITSHGLAICHSGTYCWLTNPLKVYRADASPDTVNLTSDLIALQIRLLPERSRSKVTITLDNTGGVFDNFDKLGWRVQISLGYVTSEGNEYSYGPYFWVTGWEFRSPPWFPFRALWPRGVEGVLHIYCEDIYSLLRRWKARRTFSWDLGDKNIFQLLSFIFSRVGLELYAFSTSSALVNYSPEFEIKEGRSGLWAVKKLLSMVPDQLLQRMDNVYIKNPQSDDASDYSYHSTFGMDHLLFRGHYGAFGWDPNRVQVWGDSLMVEDYKWDQIEQVYDRLGRVTKPSYTSQTRAEERAEAELRKSEMFTAGDGWCQVPVNVGQEVFDVVTLTDIPGGVTGLKKRVTGMQIDYDKVRWRFIQKLILGDV